MRLTHIKLAGFKSFVDPTVIPVPGQLVAVVGPNGCGKSNVIDAVRWVLGESSAKQLRGESMQDVIFNGSGTRKPVSRASVELVFDNAEGRAAGQWSQYAEISIKRVLTRQGESSYYINNLQCRRRDIADLFLGTGVGRGGYAVIEQGMISRIIEARPEELRAFLEEAAGVSKYKERRRETEGRLGDTRDNLARVDDIRQELDRQLEKLESQAVVAGQYQEIKQKIEEKQNLLALQRKLDAVRDEQKAQQEIEAAQNEIEALTARLRHVEAEIDTLRDTHYSSTDTVQAAQAELFEANSAVARLEQQLVHLRETRQRLSNQLNQEKLRLTQLTDQITAMGRERQDWTERREDAVMAAEDAAATLLAESDAMPRLEAAYKAADHAYSTAQLALSQSRQARQLAEQQIAHLERGLQQLRQRLERQQTELARLPQPDPEALALAQQELEELAIEVEEAGMALSEAEHAVEAGETGRLAARQQLELLRGERTELAAREKALSQLQAQVGADRKLADWLKRHGLESAPRLFSLLDITPGWETAVEAVLRERLHAVVASATPDGPAPARLTLLASTGSLPSSPAIPAGWIPLRQHVQSANPAVQAALQDWLGSVFCVDDVMGALERRAHLPTGGLLVDPRGHAASRHGWHFFAADDGLAGVLARQRELESVTARLQEVEPAEQTAQQAMQAAEAGLNQAQQDLKQARQRLDGCRSRRGEKQVELARLNQAAEQARERRGALLAEIDELNTQIRADAEEMEAARLESEALQDGHAERDAALETARLGRSEAETALDIQRSRLRQAERAEQEAGFARQTAESKLSELQRREQELAEQREETQTRLEEVMFDLDGIDEGEFDVGFQSAVNQRSEKERALAAARDAANHATNTLRTKELEKTQIEQMFEPARNRIGDLRLKEQEARLAVERFNQELLDAGADEAALLPLIGSGLKVQTLVGEIGRLTQQINSLGAVNLAALQELTTARERKTYLDAQAADLTAAMDTLENAIRRIDKETRSLLQTTFDQVNSSLMELFPLLFGGGQAELILTGEEILDAGIQIMAHPPGKKNSTIHLLSGGEKALTALSLVFALFQLNPAPFCLLDEVDAPLDDANTSRFCELVKRMAIRTQFLYISHNKLTMEMASQLVGITMQEQGVSRVVAVDIEAALQMREVSGSAA